MWHTMHWDDGMARVNSWRIGWPGSPFGMVGSRVAVVPVHHVAGAAARGAVVARLVVGALEPEVRVVQARLGDVDDRHRYAAAGARAAVRLADVGASGLVELLQRAGVVGQADLGELA